MKKYVKKLIIILNIIIWSVLSFINYIGIIQQLNNDVMRIFIWSIFMVTLYGVIIYSITLQINRILLFYHYKDIKVKHISNRAYLKQNLLLAGAIIYLYGVCYSDLHFLGLLPMILFFSKAFTNMGRFYVYDQGRLLMIEDITKEYQVIDFNLMEKKLTILETDTKSSNAMEIVYKMDQEETKFLNGFFIKDFDKMEVA